MSKNIMNMNFLVGKSYMYLKRLFGDLVNIPQDFIINDNDTTGNIFENTFIKKKSEIN